MAYRLKRDRDCGTEAKRIYQQQLTAALAAISDAGFGRGGTVHGCRKRVKKARAILEAMRDVIPVRDAWHELRMANSALGTLSDAHRSIAIVAALKRFDNDGRLNGILDRLRSALVGHAATVERLAEHGHDRARVTRLLESARGRASEWDVTAVTPSTVIDAIADAHKRARRARRAARRCIDVERHHRWRRRVKVEWYLVRLAAEWTGERMIDDQHRLAALDARLGRLHDASILAATLASEPLLPRHDTAMALLVIRQYARDLRRQAVTAAVVLDDPPADLRRRVERLWGREPRSGEKGSEWQPAA